MREIEQLRSVTVVEEFERLLNVIDVEATCWKDMPPPGAVNEIIEIGVCVVDTVTWERVLKRSIMVRPQRSSVSAFCTELTGITQAQADAGLSFADACGVLRDELHADSREWASWGDYDRKQFERQCSAGRVAYPFSGRHTNAKVPFTAAFQLRKRPGMAQALQVAGLPLEGRHHSGADDAWNIAALIIELARRGHPIR